MAVRAALLLPLFVLVFGDEPPAAASAHAAWAWVVSVKVRLLNASTRQLIKGFVSSATSRLPPATPAWGPAHGSQPGHRQVSAVVEV